MTKFRAQKNIYSRFILQRILDHWGVGKIDEVTYFNFNAPNVWRHFVETNQGSFELFSYPHYKKHRSEKAVFNFFQKPKDQQPTIQPYYRFGRYHLLIRLTKKHLISVKQAMVDLKLLEGQKIRKIFRVYGSILQMEFDDKSNASSYGRWKVEKLIQGQPKVLVDTIKHTIDDLDEITELIETLKPSVIQIILDKQWLIMRLNYNLSLHFHQQKDLSAVDIHIAGRQNELAFFSQKEIYYIKSHFELVSNHNDHCFTQNSK